MPTLDALLHAMENVIEEMEVHTDNLSDPELEQCQRDVIGRYAAEGVRRGLTVVAMHQRLLSLQLDEMEMPGWVSEGLVEAD